MRPKPDFIIKLCSCDCDPVLNDNNMPGDVCQHQYVIPLEVRERTKCFIVSDEQLISLMKKLNNQIELGLNHRTRAQSSVKCYNTYVQDLPTGREVGKFLALDLGGTNFRVLLINLDGGNFNMQFETFKPSEEIISGPGVKLFDYIAECLAKFTKKHAVNYDNLPLGFTFSFPLNQIGLAKGILARWTKGFTCSGVVDEDVVQLMKEALNRRNDLVINICAILNDTTGTLMSCAWKNFNCRVGVILGTGSNACYVERIENIPDFDGDSKKEFVIINTEWGAFGDNGELDNFKTPFDKEVDANSNNPKKQIFEKMISGMYLGELVRLVIVKLNNEKLIFKKDDIGPLLKPNKFKTEFISVIESENPGQFREVRKILLKEFGITQATDQDLSNLRYICECVSRRAANLASAGIATLLKRMTFAKTITVGVDGSLYRHHPNMNDLMIEKIEHLIEGSHIKNFELMLSEDGSGRGAALVAAASLTY